MSDPRRPAGIELSSAWVRGAPGLRLFVVLRAPGCAYARTDPEGGCTNCGFWTHLTTGGAFVSAEEYQAQLEAALDDPVVEARLRDVAELDLFCSGSLLCDGEVGPEARRLLLERAARLPGLRVLLVESRPEYVTAHAITPLLSALPRGVLLEVAIGLESADRDIRELRIRKGFSLEDFERAAGVLAEAGAGLVCYLLQKPLGTDEQEAVEDILRSGYYLQKLSNRLGLPVRIALQPTFVVEGSRLHQDFLDGRYTPPSLWSVLAAVRGLPPDLPIHVGLSDEGLPAPLVPAGCPRCTDQLRAALHRFNETQDRTVLDGLTCECAPLPQRITDRAG